ncbi:MAG: YolD-like family protein [Paenibacillus sp.]|uniref:YolD-like family protein n=1 Tax=Paenibacillus sp. TaxID=58172 RepID=UPI0029087A84|nr:YolD-like family protein [Paenibacillus sp.]MDU4696375.1 YolD-like family protein [Paenibacillus sp.]
MKSRLGAGLWESKFILPEHRETLRRMDQKERRKQRPILDAQEIEQIEGVIAEAFREHRAVTLRLWGEYEDTEARGGVITVQTYRREIKLSTGSGEWQWIKIEDILSASIN